MAERSSVSGPSHSGRTFTVPSSPFTCAAILLALALSGGRGPAAAAPPSLEMTLRPEFNLWSYRVEELTNRVDQLALPVDFLWRVRPTWQARGGAELVRSERVIRDQSAGFTNLDQAHLSLEARRGRIRLGASAVLSGASTGPSSDEIWVAEALEAVALQFPLAGYSTGDRLSLLGAVQVVRRRGILIQAGGALESRRAYNLRESGQQLDPGNRGRLGGSVQLVEGTWRPAASLFYQKSGQARLPDAVSYTPGSQWIGAAGTHWFAAAGWIASLNLTVSARGAGQIGAVTPLNRSGLRGGNLGSGRLALSHETRPWGWWVALSGTAVRGFSGELGHADWVEPELGLSRATARGKVRGGLRVPLGQSRSSAALRGIGLSLAWTTGLLP
jgi:hypothetical protein